MCYVSTDGVLSNPGTSLTIFIILFQNDGGENYKNIGLLDSLPGTYPGIFNFFWLGHLRHTPSIHNTLYGHTIT